MALCVMVPSRASLALMLEHYERFSRSYDVMVNASREHTLVDIQAIVRSYMRKCGIQGISTASGYTKIINCVHECDLLGITYVK